MWIQCQQAGPALWRGAAAVCVDAFPAQLPPTAWREVAAACSYEAASAELTMSSGQSALQMGLILRAEDGHEGRLASRLETLSRRIVRLLEDGGFDAHAAETLEEAEGAYPLRMNGQRIAFVPKEPDGECYIPASYGQVKPIAVDQVARVLTAHPGTSWSLALLHASLLPQELDCIAQNARYFTETRRHEAAARAYQGMQQLQGERLCFAFAHACGPEAALRELLQLHEGCGMAGFPIMAEMPGLEALMTLPFALAEQVSACGHTARQAQQLAPMISRLSFLTTSAQAAALAAFPACGEDMYGMAVSREITDRQPLPKAVRESDGFLIGYRAGSGEPVRLPPRQLTKHAVVVGMPGSGKTQFALGMLLELHRKGYPFLAIEPTKTEYRALLDVIPDLRIYTPGRSDVAPMALNPFLPPRGVTLEEFLPSLTTVFTAAFSMPQPLDTIFADVLRSCYTRYGWRSSSTVEDANVTVFGLHEFICVFRETVQRSSYSEESKQNLLSGGVYRLQALLNSNPVLFDTNNALPYESLLTQPTLIELDAIDNPEQKSLIMAMLLANLMLVVRRTQVCDGELKNVLMIDEAHLLLGQAASVRMDNAADPRAATVQLLQNITVAIRAYGTGIIFADQSPEKLTREVVDNANIKVVFRLDSLEQRGMIGSSIGLKAEGVEALRAQKPGEMTFHCNLLDRPVQIRTVNTSKVHKLRELVPNAAVASRMAKNAQMAPPYSQCAGCEACDFACRSEADYLARRICDENQGVIAQKETLLRFLGMGLPMQIRRAVEKHAAQGIDRERLTACVRAHLLRRIMLTGPAEVTAKEILRAAQRPGADESE